jgi:hypothetical protein
MSSGQCGLEIGQGHGTIEWRAILHDMGGGMAVLSEQIDLEQTAFADVDLLDGERAETTLSLSDDPKRRRGAATDMLVLTDRRLIHLADDGRAREAVFIWLADIIAVRVGTERTGGVGGYVWGVLSIIAAILVWSIWDRPVLDVVAAGVLLLMGAYLVWDRLNTPPLFQMAVSAGGSQMSMNVHRSVSPELVYEFTNRLFETKARGPRSDEDGDDPQARATFFAPG